MRRPGTSHAARLARSSLIGALLLVPVLTPGPAAGVGPLPECRLDDVLTEPRTYDDWAITQVDWNLTLGRRYRPPDLVPTGNAGIDGGGYIREVAIDDLRAMAAAARDNGTPIKVLSPYRGYRQQVALFGGYAGWNGSEFTNFDNAIKFSARPGHSEHQTGLTIDFGSIGDTALTSNWHVTPAGAWMAEHAWEFGWLMSYPKGRKAVVCYRFEPWHYRYVGRELASKIHESGLTIREYLWANYTQVDAACMDRTPAELETPGRPRSCPLAGPTPSPGATGPPGSGDPVATLEPSAPSTAAPTVTPRPVPSGSGGADSGGVAFLTEPPFIAALAVVLAGLSLLAFRQGRRSSRH